ncbi:hypothetical protein B0H21DRAFT_153462 [Amylocystis lapponica]|nr:hypothetical protein B0H21DRAFT_153462 [Amylocystis lapponica]
MLSVLPPKSNVDPDSLSGSTPASHWDPTIGQVFLGNASDVPLPPDRCLRVRRDADELDESAFDSRENSPAAGAGFDVCIECHDFAPFPSSAHIRAAEEHFAALERHWVERCVAAAEGDPSADPNEFLPPRPPPSPAAVVHLPFPSSPPPSAATLTVIMPFLALMDTLLQPPVPLTLAEARAQLAPPPLVQLHSSFAPSSLPPPSAFPASFFAELQGPQSAYTRVRSTSATSFPTPPSSSPPSSPTPSSSSSHSHSSSGSSFTAHTHTTTNTSISSTASSPPPALRSRPAKVLIYSADGYTESSVLALTLLMARAALPLPHAYLALQLNKRRSFFVYPADLAVLRRIEARFEKDRANDAADRGSPQPQQQMHIQLPLPPAVPALASASASRARSGRPAAQSVSFANPPASPAHPLRSQSESDNDALVPAGSPQGRPRACTLPVLPLVLGEKEHQVWFEDPRFDGSFPSRVLPFLYLGNLNHAVNAYMLHALGITHVVSVGECALLPPSSIDASVSMPSVTSGGAQPATSPSGHSSLWMEERAGRIKVLDIKGVCDDGIDTLAPQLEPICEWIDRARQEGGKVLVHCRVGVSRSATVTIAYVMKHLGLSLVDAYLIVRSRRLSVLIQPNMRLLYNLLGWELALARERAGGDETRLRAELARSLNWPYLAKEVHALNEKYLH